MNTQKAGEQIAAPRKAKGLTQSDLGERLGKENLIYRHAIRGINEGMNTDIEEAFTSEYIFECFAAEAVTQNLIAGAYVDSTDVKLHFKQEHFRKIVLDYCAKHGIR